MAGLLFMSAHVASQQLGSWALVVGLHQLHVDRLLHVLKGLLDQRAHHVGLMRFVNRQLCAFDVHLIAGRRDQRTDGGIGGILFELGRLLLSLLGLLLCILLRLGEGEGEGEGEARAGETRVSEEYEDNSTWV